MAQELVPPVDNPLQGDTSPPTGTWAVNLIDGGIKAECPRCQELGVLGGFATVRFPESILVGEGITLPAKESVDPFLLHCERCPTRNVILPYDTQLDALRDVHQLAQRSFYDAYHVHWPKEAHERARNIRQITFEVAELPPTDVLNPLCEGLGAYYINGVERNFYDHLKGLWRNVVKLRSAVSHPKNSLSITGLYVCIEFAEALDAELGDQDRLGEIRKIKRDMMKKAHEIHDSLAAFTTSYPRTQECE